MPYPLTSRVSAILEIAKNAYQKSLYLYSIPRLNPFKRAPRSGEQSMFELEWINSTKLFALIRRLNHKEKDTLENYFDPETHFNFYEYMQEIYVNFTQSINRNITQYQRDNTNKDALIRAEHLQSLVTFLAPIDTALQSQSWYKSSHQAKAFAYAKLKQWLPVLISIEEDNLDIDVIDEDGNTLFYYARGQGNLEVLQQLTNEKYRKKAFELAENSEFKRISMLIHFNLVDINASNELGGFAYYIAKSNLDSSTQMKTIEEYVQMGLDLTSIEDLAFMLADINEWDLVKLFLEKGYVNVDACQDEMTLFDYARMHKNQDMINFLTQHRLTQTFLCAQNPYLPLVKTLTPLRTSTALKLQGSALTHEPSPSSHTLRV